MTFQRTISFKLAWVGVIVAVVLGAAFSILQLKLDLEDENRRIDALANQILNSTRLPASQAARELDTGLAAELVAGVFLYELIASARITDERGIVLGEISQPLGGKDKLIGKFLDTKVLNYQTSLFDADEPNILYGTLSLTVDREKALSAFFDRSKFVVLSGFARKNCTRLGFVRGFSANNHKTTAPHHQPATSHRSNKYNESADVSFTFP